VGPPRLRQLTVSVVLAALMSAAPAHAAMSPTGCPQGPVVAHNSGGAVLPANDLPVACATETGYATSEPTIAATNDGTLVYSPAQSENSLTRSTDGGATWALTAPAVEQYTSRWNTNDVYVIADRRTGRVFWAHATGPTRTFPVLVDESPLPAGIPTAIAAAYGFQVYTSGDHARSWSTADYQLAPMADWEKLMVGPPPANASDAERPHGYPDVVYICANSPLEAVGPGRLCYKSLDGGASFVIAGLATPTTHSPADLCSPLGANAGVVASDGTIYMPQSCTQAAYVMVSHDEGAHYTWLRVKDSPAGSATFGTLQLRIDDADTLYASWVKQDRIELAMSRDGAQSWSRPLDVTAPGVHAITRPAPAAGARGQWGVAYYGSTDPKATNLTLYLTQTDDALSAPPRFVSGALNDPAHPIYIDQDLTGGSPRADYIGATYDADGTLWAGAIKQLGPLDADKHVATTGYVGRLAPAAAPMCVPPKRLTYKLGGGVRVVKVAVSVDGKRVLLRRGRNLRKVGFARPAKQRITVRIVTTNSGGGGVVSTRSYDGCTRTKLVSRPYRRKR
jgi:hypothetical protein